MGNEMEDQGAAFERGRQRQQSKQFFQGCLGLIVFIVVVAVAVVLITGNESAGNDKDLARCTDVDPQLVESISRGLINGVTMDGAQAVKSNDFENVWFVGAQLHGGTLDDGEHVAVWSTSRIAPDGTYDGSGLILSVGGFANEFSDWGDGGETDANLSLSDDGARLVQDCVEGEQA